jgi:hypothetical protein
MAMTFEGSSEEYNTILENINLAFTSIFITETTCKVIAYGPASNRIFDIEPSGATDGIASTCSW